jgi:hypothetical protein
MPSPGTSARTRAMIPEITAEAIEISHTAQSGRVLKGSLSSEFVYVVAGE